MFANTGGEQLCDGPGQTMDLPVMDSPHTGTSTLVPEDHPILDNGPVMEDSLVIMEGTVLSIILNEESDVMRGAGIQGSSFRVLEGSINSSLSSSNTIALLSALLIILKDEARRRYLAAWTIGFTEFVIPASILLIGRG